MTAAYDPELIERLIAAAREQPLDFDLHGPGFGLAAMADQLEAARREVERWKAIDAKSEALCEQRDALRAEVERLRVVAVDIETQRSTTARQAIEQELKLSTRIVQLETRIAELQDAWGLGCCARFVHGDGTHDPDCHKFSSAPHDSSCASPED